MRYDIRLTITYEYGAPTERARTLVHLLPSDKAGRQVVSARLLTVDPLPWERRDGTDFFGNTTTALVFRDPVERIEYGLQASAERFVPPVALDFAPDLPGLKAEIAAVRTLDATSPHHYLGPSARVPVVRDISDFSARLVGAGMTVLQVVEAVGRALHTEMRFDPKATDVNTPIAEAFANRHGVCQDFSHVMIAALRSLGIPAGYVSGFLRTIPPPGQARLEGADAMHAWVTAWCGKELGWVEYDPTNDCHVGTDHITVAYGRDYSDVSPVKGVLRTSGGQTSKQAVDVLPV